MTDVGAKTSTGTFTRMDQSTAAEWQRIAEATTANRSRVAERVLALLRSLEDITDGFAVDQLTHSLQTATRAEEAGADTELVVASLCHDMGKAISVSNHPRIAAEMLRPYVSDGIYHVIATHQDFQGRHYYAYFDLSPDLRDRHVDQPWYQLAQRFADEWDQISFDPDYPTQPLEHFEPMVREVFGRPAPLGIDAR